MSNDEVPPTIAELEATLASLIAAADRMSDHVLAAYLIQAQERLIDTHYGRTIQ